MPFYQATIPELPEGLSLAGQTAVVTGATAGIGLELSYQLLRKGLEHLIIGARDLQKGGSTRLDLLGDREVIKNNPKAKVTVLSLDLARYDSVVSFADQVLKSTDRLDFVVLSAGINIAHWVASPEGNELCFQVNVISNFIIQLILLPLLQSTSKTHYAGPVDQQQPTITWVGSMGQAFHTPIPGPPEGSGTSILEHYASQDHYSAFRRYPDTKLFVSMLSFQLASRLPENQGRVVINNVCPGTVKTGADNNLPYWLRIPMNLNRLLRGRYVADGARAVFWAARGGLHKDQPNGFYIADNLPQE
jgi:NAD(P)-dependent dehydrogenase (short-subunit alcohol dehydrogenase family)